MLKKLWFNIKWVFGCHHRLYSESEPEWTLIEMGMDKLARKLSGNRLKYGRPTMPEQRCKVCGVTFWSLTTKPYCQRRRCYVQWHLWRRVKSPAGEGIVSKALIKEAVKTAPPSRTLQEKEVKL